MVAADSRTEIAALIYRYAELLDGGDLDALAALFGDADFGTRRGGRVRGADAVRRVYEPVILYEDGTPRTKHVITNVTIALDEPAGAATARSYFTVLQAVAGFALQVIIAGRYHDRFARVGGRWRFAERRILPDLIGDLSRHMRPNPLGH